MLANYLFWLHSAFCVYALLGEGVYDQFNATNPQVWDKQPLHRGNSYFSFENGNPVFYIRTQCKKKDNK
jgi:hypothetical protein